MIHAWWLAIVIPASVVLGFIFAALCHASSTRDSFDDFDAYDDF